MEEWSRIVHEYGPSAWRTAYRLLGNDADASDCIQEAFAAALKLSVRQKVRSWPALLRRLATTQALDQLRRRYQRLARLEEMADLSAIPNKAAGPPDQAQAGELTERLRIALARLPEQQSAIFSMRFLDDLSYEQIAESMGMKAGTVGVLLHRARTALREMLETSDAEVRGVKHD